ncbi:MAG: hypothetical protein GY744_10600 [Gammaproteobacteria bacterium]|nr:hypothetical protein [Gammaproteobacteria bacterium]
MKKDLYSKYIYSINTEGSNKASSYIKAIDWLCKMLEVEPLSFDDCKNIWTISSVDRLQQLYERVLIEKRKGKSSVWVIDGIPKSYLRDGFCSAALRSYQELLIENNYEQTMVGIFDNHEGEESELSSKFDKELICPEFLIEGMDEKQGLDVVRSLKVRVNQNIFRKIILRVYNQTCCITGLNIPEINRASHIIPWANDETKRLEPQNGLCLSATYDAAFDKNLISLDDDYRLLISKNIKEYGTNEVVNNYFICKEGVNILLPDSYRPNKNYLALHRNKGEF